MNSESWLMLKVLINRFNPKAGNSLLSFLPPEESRKVAEQSVQAINIMPLLTQSQTLIDQIHYSWLQPLIIKFPESLRPFILGSLSTRQSYKLGQALSIKPIKICKRVKSFFINLLYDSFRSDHPLPLEYLPETDFTWMAKASKNDIVKLIDFLGLYDLAAEIRKIVSKEHLDNLYSCLTPQELYYLKICLYQKDKLTTTSLGIKPREKNCEKLRSLLHSRGLVRLSNALSGEHKDLVWYIAHILDVGRGQQLLDLYKETPIPNVTGILRSQVFNVMNFLKKEQQSE